MTTCRLTVVSLCADRLVMFLKSVQRIQTAEATKRWSVTFTEHQTAVTKVSGLLFLVQVGCWTPYAVLCLWTIILPPESLNVHYTLLPSVCCKVGLGPVFCQARPGQMIITKFSARSCFQCRNYLVEYPEVRKY